MPPFNLMCEEIIRLKGREDNSKENRKERKEMKRDGDNNKSTGNKDRRSRQICGNGNSEEHSERTGKSWVDRRRSEAAS